LQAKEKPYTEYSRC